MDGGEGSDVFVINKSHANVDPHNKRTTINDFSFEDKIHVGGMVDRIFVHERLINGLAETFVYGLNATRDYVAVANLKHGDGYQGEDLILVNGDISIA